MLNNFIKVWKNKGAIIEGIKNNIFRKEDVEEIVDYRMNICKMCDKFDPEGDSCVVPGTQPCCGECGCSLALKLRSLSSECDLQHWKAELDDEEAEALEEHFISKEN